MELQILKETIKFNKTTDIKLFFRPKSWAGEASFQGKIDTGKETYCFELNKDQTRQLKEFLDRCMEADHFLNKAD